ncbi:MAG: NADPH-dependent F420 reductase [Candidatus Bipolaricaulia bacterium]
MQIAILGGTGHQGPGLALRFAKAGIDVLIGSRQLDKAGRAVNQVTQILQELGVQEANRVVARTNEVAAQQGEVIFMTVPYPAHRSLLPDIRVDLQGKIFVDVTVPLVSYKPPRLEFPNGNSAAEEVQHILGEAVKVVGAFKMTPAPALAAIDHELASDVLVCGDDDSAKAEVIRLIERIGARAFDAGPLEHARILEELTALLMGLNFRYKRRAIDIRLTGI